MSAMKDERHEIPAPFLTPEQIGDVHVMMVMVVLQQLLLEADRTYPAFIAAGRLAQDTAERCYRCLFTALRLLEESIR